MCVQKNNTRAHSAVDKQDNTTEAHRKHLAAESVETSLTVNLRVPISSTVVLKTTDVSAETDGKTYLRCQRLKHPGAPALSPPAAGGFISVASRLKRRLQLQTQELKELTGRRTELS